MASFVNITVPNKYFFNSQSARDNYFVDHATELNSNLIIAIQNGSYYTLQRYDAGAQEPGTPGETLTPEQITAIETLISNKISTAISGPITSAINSATENKITKTFVKDINPNSSENPDNLVVAFLAPIPDSEDNTKLKIQQCFVDPATGEGRNKNAIIQLEGAHFEAAGNADNPVIKLVVD